MKTSREMAISTTMSLSQASATLLKARSSGATMQRLAIGDGGFVVYLRKPDLKDRLRMALMPAQMRRDAQSLVGLVLREIAKQSGVPEDSAKLVSVRDTIENRGKRLPEQMFLLQFEQPGGAVPF